MNLEEIKSMPAEKAILALDSIIAQNPGNEEALTLRGLRHWSLSHRSQAINDYLAAIKINPDSKAKEALAAANAILGFYNKDLYNP